MMQSPVQIASRGPVLLEWWRDKILRKAEKLNEYFDRITRCRVVVESPHRHRHKGKLYSVRIDIEVPGAFIVISREPCPTLNEAVDVAFDAAERRLEERARRMHKLVKHHEAPPEGRVSRLFRDMGFGFIETAEGREIYFHRNSVLHGWFDRLTVGSRVRFREEDGEKGPQASTVTLVKLAPRPEKPRRRRALRRRPAARA